MLNIAALLLTHGRVLVSIRILNRFPDFSPELFTLAAYARDVIMLHTHKHTPF